MVNCQKSYVSWQVATDQNPSIPNDDDFYTQGWSPIESKECITFDFQKEISIIDFLLILLLKHDTKDFSQCTRD